MITFLQDKAVLFMKKKFLNFAINCIKESHPDYDDIKIAEMRYSLEGFYLSFTKLIIIAAFSLILGVFKEMLIMLVIFNVLRSTGFGLHATKSWICLLSSSIVFLCFPLLSKIINIPLNFKFLLGICSILLIYIYAPADTKKRPLIKKAKREMYKFKTTIKCIFLVILSLIIKDDTISNLIIFGIWNEVFMILPITYKIFNLSYNNYKTYILENNLG
jgi:accessory gene regulator B